MKRPHRRWIKCRKLLGGFFFAMMAVMAMVMEFVTSKDYDWFSDRTDTILVGLFVFCPIASLVAAWPTLKLVRRDKQDKLRKQLNLPDRNQLTSEDRKKIREQIMAIVILLLVAILWMCSLSLYPYVRMLTNWLAPQPQAPTPNTVFIHVAVKMTGGMLFLMWPMWGSAFFLFRLHRQGRLGCQNQASMDNA
jgi:hypothetical protein